MLVHDYGLTKLSTVCHPPTSCGLGSAFNFIHHKWWYAETHLYNYWSPQLGLRYENVSKERPQRGLWLDPFPFFPLKLFYEKLSPSHLHWKFLPTRIWQTDRWSVILVTHPLSVAEGFYFKWQTTSRNCTLTSEWAETRLHILSL